MLRGGILSASRTSVPSFMATPMVLRSTGLRFSSGVGAAPKKVRSGLRATAAAAATSPKPDAGKGLEPKAEASFTTDEVQRQMEELAQLDKGTVEKMKHEFDAKEQAESRVLVEDNLYQLDVSTKSSRPAALRVFWKTVDVVAAEGAGGRSEWFHIALDGKKVKGFENSNQLLLPTKEYALAVAHEFASQQGHLNKLLMPLTDLASGAMLVSSQGIPARVDYLMSFFATDNCYFRSEAIATKQDQLIQPVATWFDRVFDVQSPRIMGIGHPRIAPETTERVRQQLLAMNLNQHQIVALCVVAQFTASLMLPLAVFNNVISIEDALKINRAEEAHNVDQHGEIRGYHDIREADSVVKVSAATVAWQMTADLPAERYAVINGMVQ